MYFWMTNEDGKDLWLGLSYKYPLCHHCNVAYRSSSGTHWAAEVSGLQAVKIWPLWCHQSVWHLSHPPRKDCWLPNRQVSLSFLVSPVPVLGQSERVEDAWCFDGSGLVSSDTPKSEEFVPTSSSLQLDDWVAVIFVRTCVCICLCVCDWFCQLELSLVLI
jgi:hypothetical protein